MCCIECTALTGFDATCEKHKRAVLCQLCKTQIESGDICAGCRAKTSPVQKSVLILDTETERMRPGCMAPPLVCVSHANSETYGLLHHTEARAYVIDALNSDAIIVGHHIAYDMVVFCAQWPDLIPLIFQTYAADRVTDTLLRDKLVDIAFGHREFGKEGKRRYSLEVVAKRRVKIELEKGGWQLRFGELKDLPLSQWPEEAKQYAIKDAVVTYGVWEKQEEDKRWLLDQYRQARAAFWLQLLSVWGITTDPVSVEAFAKKVQLEYDAIAQELIAAGLMRVKKTKKKATGLIETRLIRNTKVVQARMAEAWEKLGKAPDLTKGSPTKGRKISTSADNCDRSGDPLLEKYARLSSLTSTISTNIPLLQQGIRHPIHPYFDTLLATGRTSSSPNVQNQPTTVGVRECFVPRPGKVYAIADYSGMELRTWAQVCLGLFKQSAMADALNSGVDPHTKMASLMLGIPYEQAFEEYKKDPYGRVYKPRQSGKVCNFGFPGGLGPARFVEYARKNYGVIVTEDEAKELKKFWRTAWPEADLYADWIASQCGDSFAQLEQPFVARFRGGLTYCDASNTLFQGPAADAAKNAGFLIAQACYVDQNSPLYNGRPVNFVHDEFIVEVDDNPYAHDAAIELARLMELGASPLLPDVPPKVEPLLARRWSKKSKPIHDNNGRLVPWEMEMK